MIERKIIDSLLVSIQTSPVVFLNGPRQAGKSTLVNQLAQTVYIADYVTFDNHTQMAAAANSPLEFLRNRKKNLIIDEVQIVPEIFRPLKLIVDEMRLENKDHANGRFLLTGSANILALPKLSDALVGRMSVKTLYPLSAAEIYKGKADFLNRLFEKDFVSTRSNVNIIEAISQASFPEIFDKPNNIRIDWFDSYISMILQRDVRIFSEIEKISLLPNLLRILANRAGKLINDAEIARDLAINPVTCKAYRRLLQAMFLQFDVEPWYLNIGKRLVKSSKGFLIDTSLLCHLLDLNLDSLRERKPELFGHILENFVATELLKLLSFSSIRAKLYHFRLSDGKEVDFVLERPNGSLVGIEVKASDQLNYSHFKGLLELKNVAKDDFVCGIVLYNGNQIVPFGDDLFAVPLAQLWS